MADTGYLHDPMPNRLYLEERLKWDPEQKCLVWLRRPLWQFGNKRSWKSFNAVNAGQQAGHVLSSRNTPVITIDGVLYRQDQISYILQHDLCPVKLAYKDGNPQNIDPNNLYPDPSTIDVFGGPKKTPVVYFPKEFIRSMRPGKRGSTRRPVDGVTGRRADAIRNNLPELKASLLAYPPYAYLNECFQYYVTTGELFWKERPREHFASDRGWKIFNARHAGKLAGVRKPNQQTWIGMDKVAYKADIIAHILMGREPPLWVVHKDGDASNIKWDNMVGVYEEDL